MVRNMAGGKGSAARPLSVSTEVFGDNFDRIFGKKEVCGTCDDIAGTRCTNPLTVVSGEDGQRCRKVTADDEACCLHRQTT